MLDQNLIRTSKRSDQQSFHKQIPSKIHRFPLLHWLVIYLLLTWRSKPWTWLWNRP